LQRETLTRLDGEGGDVGNDFRPCLEDDQEDSDGASDAVQFESVVEGARVRDLTGRVRELVDVEDALQHRVVLV
jgi:hypothetical protein